MKAKPEHMTGLTGSTLVSKSHPRIQLRGKLDSLQAQVVLTQCDLQALGADETLLSHLQEILTFLCEAARCEVLDAPFAKDSLLGLSFPALREQSHNPQKYFGIKSMTLPDYHFGKPYALLNTLRAATRETELAAVLAFQSEDGTARPDLITALNRLSSALHVLMCREMSK